VQSAAEIFIYGDIGESWWSESVSAKNFVRDLNALDAEHVTIRINSIGGSVPDGIAIHNAIKRHKAQTVTVIDGMALSIASLIALAGDTVEMADNATMMIHAPWTYMAGNSAELREQADVLDTWANAMATSYAAKSGRSQDEMLALLTDGKDHWYTAAEAQEMGLVDSVVTALPLAASAAAAPADLSRFRNVPAALMAARNPSLPAAPQSAPQATSAAAAATTLENPSMTTTVTPAAAPQNPAIVPDAAAARSAPPSPSLATAQAFPPCKPLAKKTPPARPRPPA
jgi:ATP-dependent Clp endopeptidase proteolytic subunit ClpP